MTGTFALTITDHAGSRYNWRLWRSCAAVLPANTLCLLPEFLAAVCPLYPLRLVKTVRLPVERLATLLAQPALANTQVNSKARYN